MIPRHIRCLPNLMNISEAEIYDRSIKGREALLEKMRVTLRNMRQLGVARHHSYQLPIHTALYSTYRREREAFDVEMIDAALARTVARMEAAE